MSIVILGLSLAISQNSVPIPDDSIHFAVLIPYQVNGINEYGSGSYAL